MTGLVTNCHNVTDDRSPRQTGHTPLSPHSQCTPKCTPQSAQPPGPGSCPRNTRPCHENITLCHVLSRVVTCHMSRDRPVVVTVTVRPPARVALALHHSALNVLPAVDGDAVAGGEGVAVAVTVLRHHAALEVVNSVSCVKKSFLSMLFGLVWSDSVLGRHLC